MLQRILATHKIQDEKRISSIDIFRALAILSVVIYHFNETIQMGYLGVDLFFVISGFLIGRMLMREFIQTQSVRYLRFFISRGFKIWPSYYTFLVLGNILAYFMYKKLAPDYSIPLDDLPRYLFFYKNFFGTQYHWCFEHVWSLCVEEHFYLLFPLLFVMLGCLLCKKKYIKSILMWIILAVIISGIIMRCVLLEYYGTSINQYECSLVRIHELAAGVLMAWIIIYYEERLRVSKQVRYLFWVGALMFTVFLYMHAVTENSFFYRHLFPITIPFVFMMMMTGAYFTDFSKFKLLRVIAYYSYNWYLWHTLFVKFFSKYISSGILGLCIYMIVTFLIAVVTTTTIEETFLRYRTMFLDKFFK